MGVDAGKTGRDIGMDDKPGAGEETDFLLLNFESFRTFVVHLKDPVVSSFPHENPAYGLFGLCAVALD
jgi:hypothetical protein